MEMKLETKSFLPLRTLARKSNCKNLLPFMANNTIKPIFLGTVQSHSTVLSVLTVPIFCQAITWWLLRSGIPTVWRTVGTFSTVKFCHQEFWNEVKVRSVISTIRMWRLSLVCWSHGKICNRSEVDHYQKRIRIHSKRPCLILTMERMWTLSIPTLDGLRERR